MTAVFSCAAYKNFDKAKKLCKRAEFVVNDILRENDYDGIQFFNPQFSFTSFVEEIEPIIEETTLSLVVAVEQDDLPHMASALIRGLDSPVVPKKLQKDLEAAFQKNGWL